MNEIDLDAVVDSVLVWDYRVKVGGQSYLTRPATVGELVILEDAAKGKRGMGDLVEVIKDLFENAALTLTAQRDAVSPAVEDWSMRKLKAFVEGYMSFFGEWQKGQLARLPGAGEGETRRAASVAGG